MGRARQAAIDTNMWRHAPDRSSEHKINKAHQLATRWQRTGFATHSEPSTAGKAEASEHTQLAQSARTLGRMPLGLTKPYPEAGKFRWHAAIGLLVFHVMGLLGLTVFRHEWVDDSALKWTQAILMICIGISSTASVHTQSAVACGVCVDLCSHACCVYTGARTAASCTRRTRPRCRCRSLTCSSLSPRSLGAVRTQAITLGPIKRRHGSDMF
jgi:hypothetical protein